MTSDRFAEAPHVGPLLEVADIKTYFETSRGLVRAVDGVSFSLERGKTIGIVGESGSGKTVLSRSVMGLLPKRGVVREGSVKFEGKETLPLSSKDMRAYWGAQMSMIFQDPMTSLNPVMKIGKQITESIGQHLDVTAPSRRSSRRACWSPFVFPSRSSGSRSTPISSRAACASASASPSRSRAARSSSSLTSRRLRSMSRSRRRCST